MSMLKPTNGAYGRWIRVLLVLLVAYFLVNAFRIIAYEIEYGNAVEEAEFNRRALESAGVLPETCSKSSGLTAEEVVFRVENCWDRPRKRGPDLENAIWGGMPIVILLVVSFAIRYIWFGNRDDV